MKRVLCLLLVLFLLPAAALADSPADPVLVPIAPETLPEGQYCHLGGSRILVKTGDYDPLLIYDLNTGETVIVTPREEDHELWVELGVNDYIAALATEGVICTDEEVERLRSYFVGDYLIYLFVMGSSIHVNSIGTEYVTLCEGFLLNRHTGVITFIPEGLSANKFTSWDTFLSTNEEHTVCLQYDINGQLLNTTSFEDSDHQLWGVVPLKNGTLAMLYLTDKENQKTHYQFVLLDKELNVQQVIDTGSHHNQWLDVHAAHLYEENGRLLLLTDGTCYGTAKKYRKNGRWSLRKSPTAPTWTACC